MVAKAVAAAVALGTAAFVLMGPAADRGDAYRVMATGRPFPGPVVTYRATLFRGQMKELARAVNRARVGIRLRPTRRKRKADIKVGALKAGCGHGLTAVAPQLGPSGFRRNRVRILVPRGCNAPTTFLTVTHELAHALGLDHVPRGCASMSVNVTRACQLSIIRSPRHYRPDDLAGFRRVWRNTGPKAAIETWAPYHAGTPATFFDASRDRQQNIARATWDFGDPGSAMNVVRTRVPRGHLSDSLLGGPEVRHTFSHAGTFTVRLTVVDTYGRRSTTKKTVAVEEAEQLYGAE